MFCHFISPSEIFSRISNPPQPLHPRPQPTAEYVNIFFVMLKFIILPRFQSTSQAPLLRSPPTTQKRGLRHIVLDGQNIARK